MPADPLLRAEVCQVYTSGEQYGRVTELEDGQYVVEWSDGEPGLYSRKKVEDMVEVAKQAKARAKSPPVAADTKGKAESSSKTLGTASKKRRVDKAAPSPAAQGAAGAAASGRKGGAADVSSDDFEEKPRVGGRAARGRRAAPVSSEEEEEESEEEESEEEESEDDESASASDSPQSESESESEEAPKKKKGPPKKKPAAKPAAKPKPAAAKPPAAKKAPARQAKKLPATEGGDDDDEEEEDSDAVFEAKPRLKPKKRAALGSGYKPLAKKRWSAEEIEALPVLVKPQQMFDDMVTRTEAQQACKGAALEGRSLEGLARELAGRPLRVATMCSGTESPLLALDMICGALKAQSGQSIAVEHVFSCEIEPFKQAYIERNFAPPLLFRDIRELGDEEATTAYGATRPVPGEVDVLIAGTSCVDYSTMNNKQKKIDEKGESGQTFWGMLAWVKRTRPSIVVQENVCSAPWEEMVGYYAKEGYAATFLRVDTKNHYIPHTRTRIYLLALDTHAPNRRAAALGDAPMGEAGGAGESGVVGEEELARWEAAISELSCPASSSLEAFLLPTDDPRVHTAREDLSHIDPTKQRGVVDWGRCETRHQRARTDEELGAKRPLTQWVSQGHCAGPDFAWHDWFKSQVERVVDLCDINYLRLAREGQDANYKTLVWNLSQNVDRSTASSRPGVCPCLTPNMVPYVTNRGGPIVGPEVLALQGIPVDDLLLTRENNDQMADLAGNAMSSTIVGTCILAALLLSRDTLRAFDAPKPDAAAAGAGGLVTSTGSSETQADVAGGLAMAEKPLALLGEGGVGPLAQLLAEAAGSARMCASEGRTRVASDIVRCAKCGTTKSKSGCPESWPEHVDMAPVTEPRTPPREFEAKLAAALPMVVTLGGLGCADGMRPAGALLPAGIEAKLLSPTRGGGDDDDEDEDEEGAPRRKAKAKPAAKKVGPMDRLLGKKKKAEPPTPLSPPRRADAAAARKSPPRQRDAASSKDEALWRGWAAAVKALERERFTYAEATRGESWSVTFRSEKGRVVMHLGRECVEWLAYASPPPQRGVLRELLLQPVARMRVPASAAGLLDGAWELCLPVLRQVPVTVASVGEPVESWQASIGLEAEWKGSTRFRSWRVEMADSAARLFDVDVRGEYELLEKCGGAMNCLHRRVGDGAPLFLFLDPHRIGAAEHDSVVFATSAERVGYGETRRTVASLDASWRPWTSGDSPPASRSEAVHCIVRGAWAAAPKVSLSPVGYEGAKHAYPAAPPKLALDASSRASATAPAAVPVVRCAVPLSEEEAAAWPKGEWEQIAVSKSRRKFEAISWITERLDLPPQISEWTALGAADAFAAWSAGGSPCEVCAPAMPKLQWAHGSRGQVSALEDPVQAGAYEQALKRRPAAFGVKQRAAPAPGVGSALLGELEVSANPLALAMRALALVPVGGDTAAAELSWRIVRHCDTKEGLPPLTLSSNKHDPAAPQPPHFGPFKGRVGKVLALRPEQQRSLSWMLEQEEEGAAPFIEEEVAEATLPALNWRLEARARVPRVVRGGVLADEVGYGKTVITVALIDAAPREPLPPPPPLRRDGFIPLKATLVLAPSHLLRQWPTEVERFTGGALNTVVLATMADVNKHSVKDLEKADVVVCAITLLRNDLYFERLAAFAGSGALPNGKASLRHFTQAYGEALGGLQEQVASLSSGDLSAAQRRVADGRAGRASQKKAAAASVIGKSLGNTANRVEAGVKLESMAMAVAPKGKKATYAAEKKAAAAKAKTKEEAEEEEAEEEEEEEEAPPPKKARTQAKPKPAARGKGTKRPAPAQSQSDEDFADSDEEAEEEEESDEYDESESEEERPAKKRPAAKAKRAAKPEEKDPWGLHGTKASKDWKHLQALPVEMFYWNRVVIDEFTYNNERDNVAIVTGVKAAARWVLSGTPDVSGFSAVAKTAQWLGLTLGSSDASELTKAEQKQQSAAERFAYFKEVHTPAWHATRHAIAQDFLDRFVRQNVAEIDEIPWREQAAVVALPPPERALYIELKNHLEALDMKNSHKTIKSKCKSENDREARLANVLGGSASPEEALLKRCSHFDMVGNSTSAAAACDEIVATRTAQLQLCADEIERQTAYARDAIGAFEAHHKPDKLDAKQKELLLMPRTHFDDWRSKEVAASGDDEAARRIAQLVKAGLARPKGKVSLPSNEKGFKDKLYWTRDQVHLLRRLQKELVGRVRSLRFFEAVRTVQRGGSLPGLAAGQPSSSLSLLSSCGHAGPHEALCEHAERQECPHPGCKAAVRPGCVIRVGELGSETADGAGGAFGAKLSAVASLIGRTREEERVLVFVQFPDLLQKVHEALTAAGLRVAMLKGTPTQRSKVIEDFQQHTLKKGDARVLLLNLRDESAAGANLTQASHAIFLHPLLVGSQQEFDSCDTQAVGRIRRYGQQRTVQIYRFVVESSIDTDILTARRADASTLLAEAGRGDDVAPLE